MSAVLDPLPLDQPPKSKPVTPLLGLHYEFTRERQAAELEAHLEAAARAGLTG